MATDAPDLRQAIEEAESTLLPALVHMERAYPDNRLHSEYWGTLVTALRTLLAASRAAMECPVDHSTCSRCDRDTKNDPQVFLLCDRCYGATRATPPCPDCGGNKTCKRCGGSGGGDELPLLCGECGGSGACQSCEALAPAAKEENHG